ncbi:MAG TPA: acylphosphatase [Ohtaekwangia sp.]|uniref:acylphosphatase n=1 Tax=Ohtaekwangia sp. TaxID=2066019 RepID=UPI002F9228E0
MQKHISIVVSGRVQGVYYRVSAQEAGEKLGLKGFVRNLPDGSVYIEAEGDEKALSEFVAWCEKGPVRARVTDVDVQDGTWQGFTDFVVKR